MESADNAPARKRKSCMSLRNISEDYAAAIVLLRRVAEDKISPWGDPL
jgi:hypothetical protein